MNCSDCSVECEDSRGRRYCSECKLERKRQRGRRYCAENREAARIRARAWHHDNKERAAATAKRRRVDKADVVKQFDANRYPKEAERRRAAAKRWYAENRKKVLERASSESGRKASRDRMRRRMCDPLVKVHSNISRAIRNSIRDKRSRPWEMMIGYTSSDLVRHLERQFLPGMSWENYGRGDGKWHIDHIVPKSFFGMNGSEAADFLACWAITNLRPLWGRDNISKHANRTHLL